MNHSVGRLAAARFLALLGLFAAGPSRASDGYRITADAIRVDRSEHWQAWTNQNDVVSALSVPMASSALFDIDAQGVRPRFFRSNVNAALDAGQYRYDDQIRSGTVVAGGVVAQSNSAAAPLAADGRLDTWWEPAAADMTPEGVRQWDLELDLGRLVQVDSLAVIVPGPADVAGDAPKSFVVFGSLGERYPFPSGRTLSYVQLARATRTELQPCPEGAAYRQLTVVPEPLLRADFDLDGRADMTGSSLQYLRVKVLDSDLDRARLLGVDAAGQAAWEALPPARRGTVVYQRITAGGDLVEVTRDVFMGEVDPTQRGPVRYYARELPRILEVRIWARGDNLALNPEARAGGSYELGGRGTPWKATDGVYATEWMAWGWNPLNRRGTLWLDLGATFWVNSVYMVVQRASEYESFTGHEIMVSDGTQVRPVHLETVADFEQLEYGLRWNSIVAPGHIDNRTSRVLMFGEQFPLRQVRFLQLRNNPSYGGADGARLAELQVYGAGYPVSASLESPPMSLTDAQGRFVRKTMPSLRWESEAVVRDAKGADGVAGEHREPLSLHPDVDLQLQSRTADQTDTNWTYYEVVDISGQESRTEVTKDVYDALVFRWAVWDRWTSLTKPHQTGVDDDGDGSVDEDEIDLVDNDGDGKIDEDGKKLGSGKKPKSSPWREGKLALVGWSEWSDPYRGREAVNTAQMLSPSPRRFLQLRVRIQSDDPQATACLRSLSVQLIPPVALELAGELARLTTSGQARGLADLAVDPGDYGVPREVDPTRPEQFSYFVRLAGPDPLDPEVRAGVDELVVAAPQPLRVLAVRVGQVTVPAGASGSSDGVQVSGTRWQRSFVPAADGALIDAAGQRLTLTTAATGDTVQLRFPAALNVGLPAQKQALVEVRFESQVYRQNAQIDGFAAMSTSVTRQYQRVDGSGQDATELVDSRSTAVGLLMTGAGPVQELALPRCFSPNGDGVNDVLVGRFLLLRMLAERSVEVSIYDLRGQRVGQASVTAPQTASGEVSFSWDGRDGQGKMVPPGAYLCRVRVDADQGSVERLQVIAVAY